MSKNKLLDAQRYAILTGLSYQTVLNYVDAGLIPYQLINRHCFFTIDSLALGLILSTKTNNVNNYLDFYFIGSDLSETEKDIQHSCFNHSNAVDFSDLCKKITSEYELNFKACDNVGYNYEIINSCRSKIVSERQEALEEFDRKWQKKYSDGGNKYLYNIKKNRILDNYKLCGNELGKKAETILDEFLFDGIKNKVTQDCLGKHIKQGICISYDYDTTDKTFNVADFIEQIVRTSRTKRYSEVNVCIFGKVPEYVSNICKRLADIGVLTNLINKDELTAEL